MIHKKVFTFHKKVFAPRADQIQDGAPVHHLRPPVCGRGSDVGVFLPSLEAWVPIRAKLAEAARVDLDQRDSGLGRRLLVRFEGNH